MNESSEVDTRPRHRRVPQSLNRRGAATVELAACIPLLALLVYGSIQASDLIYLKHSVTSAAFEGTIELIRPSADNTSVVARVEQVLAMHSVKNFDVEILPAGTQIADLPQGTPVEIRVRADVDSNLAIGGWFPTADFVEHKAVGPR